MKSWGPHSFLSPVLLEGSAYHISHMLLRPADAFGFESNAFSDSGAPPPEAKFNSQTGNGPSSSQGPASFDAFGSAGGNPKIVSQAQPQNSGDEWDLFFTDK